jgi:hypothetical protein
MQSTPTSPSLQPQPSIGTKRQKPSPAQNEKDDGRGGDSELLFSVQQGMEELQGRAGSGASLGVELVEQLDALVAAASLRPTLLVQLKLADVPDDMFHVLCKHVSRSLFSPYFLE